ncbi:MAG TPA: hypothetical protein VFB32_11740 [Rudaea sp.]|nr:hypothetical protein [Rudaea sp.]
MNSQSKRPAGPLIRAVAMLQLKLFLGAARDLVLVPLTLIAAAFDLFMLKSQEPRYFRHVLRVGEHTESWIDLWSGARDPGEPPRENVDALLARIEEVVRDREEGARQARVLKRWAERQMQRARQRAEKEMNARMQALAQKRSRD